MRPLLVRLFRAAVRLFFRRVEASGLDRLPRQGACVLVLNHPNGLLDPLLVLCEVPRSVSFLAKAPLFRMPVVGFFVRAFDSIPVFRRQDEGSDPARNRETFEKARGVLAGGGVLALFPEGTSHDEARLKPLKTGAARIALGASAALGEGSPLLVVPIGLFFTRKSVFRSDALLVVGEPFPAPHVPLEEETGEPPAGPVRDLTGRIREALDAVTLQADEREALDLAARAEEVLTGEEPGLSESFDLQRRLLAGYAALRARRPAETARLLRRLRRFSATLDAAGLSARDLSPGSYRPARVALATARTAALVLLLLPLALPGALLHAPAYHLCGFLSRRLFGADEAVVATVKLAAALLLYPLTWALAAFAGYHAAGPWAAAALLLLLPASALAALAVQERLEAFAAGARAFGLLALRERAFSRLLSERESIREEILALARELPGSPATS